MSDTRTEAWNAFFWILLPVVAISIAPYKHLGLKPIDAASERWMVYALTAGATVAHVHYGTSVVSKLYEYNS